MKFALSFDDVLITPRFTDVESRALVDTSVTIGKVTLRVPLLSANMDTVTGSKMAWGMYNAGGIGVLHRFQTIEENCQMYENSPEQTFCSVGITENELNRAYSLWNKGCRNFVIDVANAASQKTVDFYLNFLEGINYRESTIIIGNFATRDSVLEFLNKLPNERYPHALKIGVGGGSMCSTRVVTGCGWPTLQSLLDCSSVHIPLIACGGMKNSGDIAKALAVPNVVAVMLGGMLAATEEAPGQEYVEVVEGKEVWYKKYRGSASLESYQVQNKIASHRSPEGESTWLPNKGPVNNIVQQIEGGLRSAFSYVNATNLETYQDNVELVQVTTSGHAESKPHGVNKNVNL